MSPGDLTKMSAKDMVVNIKSEPLDNSTADSAPSYDELQQLRVDHNNGLADLNTMVPSALNIGIIPDIEGICPAPGPLSAPLPRNNSVAIGDSPPLLRRYESDAMMRQRLFTTLKHTFPGSALMKALYFCSNELNTNDKLTSSCFGSLNLDKVKLEEFDSIEGDDDLEAVTAQAGNLPEGGGSAKTWIDSTSVQIDDDLTSLGWLQDHELLKNITTDELKIDISRQEHPSNIPYNPQKHIKSKPPYSFSCLIFMAIEDIANKRLPVKDIYGWMLRQFPYFRNAPTGWKNSVRHNLSLNKCFRKVDRYQKGSASGKGSLWMIDPDYRPNLLQALRKTPYHPFHQLQMMSNTNGLPPPTSTLTPKDGMLVTLHTLSTFSINSPHTLHTLSTHSPHTIHKLTTHSPHTLHTLTTHTPHTLHTLSTHSPHTHHTLSINSPHTLPTLRTLSTHSPHTHHTTLSTHSTNYP